MRKSKKPLTRSDVDGSSAGESLPTCRAETPYAICGFVYTAAKHGVDIMTVIRDALLGRAWIPPDPAPV
ncbi:hypothetical protein ACIBQX_19290 [Nonomuraea sp. NPDC049714]|uniref:hypothetical protein n=1 Tax=Nonomuraea sp. NPDC049714 TaxID=3364357 RepID=UPI0037A09EA3